MTVERSQQGGIFLSKSVVALLVAFDELVEQTSKGVNVSKVSILDDVQLWIGENGSLLSHACIVGRHQQHVVSGLVFRQAYIDSVSVWHELITNRVAVDQNLVGSACLKALANTWPTISIMFLVNGLPVPMLPRGA